MAECMTPYIIVDKQSNQAKPVPCGKCPACYKRRVSGWVFRLLQEEKVSISSNFITLTYDTAQIPITDCGSFSLEKRELQLFFKRLRKQHNTCKTIKYYAVGEYGAGTMRPHYHIILFNAELELIQPAWKNGFVHYGDANVKSMTYCVNYVMKRKKIPMWDSDDRQKEFSLMSKGLGETYLNKAMLQWHKADELNRMHLVLKDGKKAAMPRYYKNKIYSDNERKYIVQELQKKLEKEVWKQADQDPLYYRNKVEAQKMAFKKMDIDEKRRSKI